ncbi:MAG: hypothetical protein K1000chlam2_00011 [Chlamydiae bacterium]|nr:hypothetical protein [Chlamydiota bacterium]
MTLPSNIILPLHSDYIKSGEPKDMDDYMRELNFSLQRMYEMIAEAVNGTIRADFGVDSDLWTPLLKGTTTSGSFTYTHNTGWVLRQGIIVDVWFDIQWSATGGASGNLFIELPYKVALANQKPFVGVVQSSALTYTGGTGIVVNGISNTFRAEFWNVGSAFTTARQAVVGSGQLIGHIRYIGQQDE